MESNGIGRKDKTEGKMHNVRLQRHRMWCSSGLQQSLARARCSGPCPGGFQVPQLWHFLMDLSECSSSSPYLFNMHFHHTTLNVHRGSLFLRYTSKSCTEIHLLIKDVSLPLADALLSFSILGDNFLFTHFSDTTMMVTAYKSNQIHTTFM